MAMLELNDRNFTDEVLKSNLPVCVDFWAPWCSPCKMIAPLIEELAQVYNGKIKFGKVNVDENPRTPSQYGIMAIPTLIFFKDGQITDQISGVLSKPELKKKIEASI